MGPLRLNLCKVWDGSLKPSSGPFYVHQSRLIIPLNICFHLSFFIYFLILNWVPIVWPTESETCTTDKNTWVISHTLESIFHRMYVFLLLVTLFYLCMAKKNLTFSFSFGYIYFFVLLYVPPVFPGDNVCYFISLFLAFHQRGHLAYCHISGQEEMQRHSLSPLWPWGLIFKGASCAVSPHDNKNAMSALEPLAVQFH